MRTHYLHPFISYHTVHRSRWFWFGGKIALFLLFSLTLSLSAFYLHLPANHIARGVWVGEQPIGGLSFDSAREKLEQLERPQPFTIHLRSQDASWQRASSELNLRSDAVALVDEAAAIGRTGSLPAQLWDRLQKLWKPVRLPARFRFSDEKLLQWFAEISPAVTVPGRDPQAKVDRSAPSGFRIDSGLYGQTLDEKTLLEQLRFRMSDKPLELPILITHTPLSPDGLTFSEARLKPLTKRVLTLTVSPEQPKQTVAANTFFPWLRLPDGFREATLSAQLEQWDKQWSRPAQDAEFALDQTNPNKLATFVPHRAGRELDQAPFAQLLKEALAPSATQSAWSISVPLRTTEPAVPLAKTNSLGIVERIGLGTSDYAHSIPNRIFNVQLTSDRLHATLVKPGEEFSFGNAVGDINRATGFKTAYVIRNNRTELGDGGGVCQVSSTTFRAVLNAGLPITQWKPHSYRVGYYEQNSQPGFDATIYAPSVDLKFRNDTGKHLVVASYADSENTHLIVEIWGTRDGRVSEISNYSLSGVSPPPPALYVEDPSLPRGKRQQVDWSAPGGTARFLYTVRNADGTQRLQREFVSHFKPWQAVYLVGTGQ